MDMVQLEYLVRILIAAACGGAIGYERERRQKMAGIRTHLIVCIAASLMIIVSKYGFFDVAGKTGIVLDPSRMAASAVAAIGFIGAGVIFVRNYNVSGITTAAGLWATVGVGMAVGAGMYFIGAAVTIIIVLLQIVLHTRLVKGPMNEQIVMQIRQDENAEEIIQDVLKVRHIEINNMSIKKAEKGSMEIKLYVRYPRDYDLMDSIELLKENPNIKSIEI